MFCLCYTASCVKKKESRVSTLTIAQAGDYRFDIVYVGFRVGDFMQICKWIVGSYSLILFDGGALQLAI